MTPADFAAFPTGNICNADPEVRALRSDLKPLIPGQRIAGPARTVRITPGQNAAIHRAVHTARSGEVLVVDGGASDRFGPFGDLLADGCKAKGLVGAVFDCTIRDSADIAALRFQVFCRGFHPEATAKTAWDEIDIPVVLGGVSVSPGDIIVGDDDGVVVIPSARAKDVLASVVQVAAREEAIRARILAGETTFDIFELGAPGRGRVKAEPLRRPDTFFNFADLRKGIVRTLASGIKTRVFPGDQAMFSVVHFEPNSQGAIHAHPEEQWGVLLEGNGIRIQDGVDVPVGRGDFWRTPGGVAHGFRAGPDGAQVLDVFAPPRAAYRQAGSGFAAEPLDTDARTK